MKNSNLPKYRNALLRWRGWRSMAAFCTRAWHSTLRWSGWTTLFSLSVPLTLLLNAACAAGLIWVFVHGLEAWIPAYFLYALSTYSLAALCARLPAIARGVKAWLFRHPQLDGLLKNRELRFKLGLYFEQLLNTITGCTVCFLIVSIGVYMIHRANREIKKMLIGFTQHEQKATLGPLSEGAVTACGGDWGSVLLLEVHPLHRFAVPLPLWGRQEGCCVKPISIIKKIKETGYGEQSAL